MTCTDFLAKLTDFFDGNVPPALMAAVEEHFGVGLGGLLAGDVGQLDVLVSTDHVREPGDLDR